MRMFVIVALAACGGSQPVATKSPIVAAPGAACRTAYAEYEVEWRAARADDLLEPMAGYEDLAEDIIRTELLTTPSRAEVSELREINAVVDALVWDSLWPRALKAADAAIDSCGEHATRPAS